MLDVAKIDTEVAELLDQLGSLSFGDCVIAGVKEDAATAFGHWILIENTIEVMVEGFHDARAGCPLRDD